MHTFVLGDCLGVLILLISMLRICLQHALPLISPYKVQPQHNGNSFLTRMVIWAKICACIARNLL